MTLNKPQLLDDLITLSWRAGNAILEFYHTDKNITIKEDGSPLTKADLASNEIICTGLKKLTPDIPIISEESASFEVLNNDEEPFWLVDPLDGTKEFINKNGEFTTNIALIEQCEPTLGVICAPAIELAYAGIVGIGAFKQVGNRKKTSISTRSPTKSGSVVLGSRSHASAGEMTKFLEGKKVLKTIPVGSSLKFCKIAEGSAHIYPRLGRTMEWDTAAGHAILLAAGGSVESIDKRELQYNKINFENPFFIAQS